MTVTTTNISQLTVTCVSSMSGTLYIIGQETPRITAWLTLTSGLARGPWRHAAANK